MVGKTIRLFLYVALIITGAYILFGFVNPAVSRWWAPFIIVIAGIFIIQGGHNTVLPGAIMILIGLFLIARAAGLITTPWLRYGMGGSIALIGALGFLRELRQPNR